jgi:diguanylate cyclase (GGDEF)-like protein
MKAFKILLLIIVTCNTLFAQELEKVSLQLQWLNQFQFAGFYVAKEQGYYREAGLDVDILEFQQETDVHNITTNYMIGRSSLILHKVNHDDSIVILDVLFEHSPAVLMSTNPKIKRPIDLKNRRIMMTGDQAISSSFYAMLKSQGLDESTIYQQKHSFDLNDLIEGKTDAMACYLSNEPFTLKEKGIPFTVFNPRDYGYDFYGDLLYTTTQELKEHPKRTRSFVHASRKGWKKAFENIKATAQLIYDKYNTQNKSLKSLIQEGEALKSLWCDNPKYGPVLSYERFKTMAEFYRINNLIPHLPNFNEFLDPLNFNRQNIKIGVLAKRGAEYSLKRWRPMINDMNIKLPQYHFQLVPLNFEEVYDAVKNERIDFIITNSMQFIQLEAHYGVSRMATFLNPSPQGDLSQFGAVIFTKSENRNINTLADIRYQHFGAVNPYSFGGWIMAKKLLKEAKIPTSKLASLKFFNTHDKVVKALFDGSIDVGTVRTDILEKMEHEKSIDLKEIKVIHPQHYDDFPYRISTQLYPEWSFAKLSPTSLESANNLLSYLLASKRDAPDLPHWSIPINYKPIHDLLMDLELDPYPKQEVSFSDFYAQYRPWILSVGVLFIIMLFFVYKIKYLNSVLKINNRQIKNFNLELERNVAQRTKELKEANEKLRELTQIDDLTQITSRREFLTLANHDFATAKRQNNILSLLSLDIDYFKHINDTHGHDIGDEILKLFAQTISKILRKSDLFGRIGGEEFSILLPDTPISQALELADKLRREIEKLQYPLEKDRPIRFTVSIGACELSKEDEKFSEMMKRCDQALYNAKEQGRNRVEKL